LQENSWYQHARRLILATLLLLYGASWHSRSANSAQGSGNPASSEGQYREERERMVREQIEARGVRDPRVLAAMRKVPRHLYVPPDERPFAYADTPLPIGYNQTISQPYVVAFMTEALELKPQDRVLEIGTGSGYQAAVLAELVRDVYTVEILEPLARQAEGRLQQMGYANVHVQSGDGYRGWPEAAPFDGIMVTAAPDHVPPPLLEQLREGGRLVLPLGRWEQDLVRLRRTPKGITRESLLPVRFVPMTGEAEKPGAQNPQ
jgi:protein-L-isoaspartate(D-aspartate) O-methyltransferase